MLRGYMVGRHKHKAFFLISSILFLILFIVAAQTVNLPRMQKRYLAIGFDDFRDSDFTLIEPLLDRKSVV